MYRSRRLLNLVRTEDIKNRSVAAYMHNPCKEKRPSSKKKVAASKQSTPACATTFGPAPQNTLQSWSRVIRVIYATCATGTTNFRRRDVSSQGTSGVGLQSPIALGHSRATLHHSCAHMCTKQSPSFAHTSSTSSKQSPSFAHTSSTSSKQSPSLPTPAAPAANKAHPLPTPAAPAANKAHPCPHQQQALPASHTSQASQRDAPIFK